MKKVLLIVIDALASRVVLPALERGDLPTFSQLIEHGTLSAECTCVFPSITPAATCSIVTGRYPTEHGIAGGFWYDREADDVAYFGDDFWVVADEGMGEFFTDFLVRLNQERLQVETLYEVVERCGKSAAALNYMWFHGEHPHEVNAPWLFKMIPGIEIASDVKGPETLALADFARSTIPGETKQLSATGGVSRRFGFHDDSTAEFLMDLTDADPFPDFTLAYFPNNDFESHCQGPEDAFSTVKAVDDHLGEFIAASGGMEKFLSKIAVVISGDHSQTDMTDDASQRGIDVAKVLEGFQLTKTGKTWNSGDDVMVCPNMRACHIYIKDKCEQQRKRVVDKLLTDSRIDQVFWRDGTWQSPNDVEPVHPDRNVFHVETADRGTLTFRTAESPDGSDVQDVYGTHWSYEGDLSAIDATRNDDARVQYGEYPNAFERIATGFCRQADDLWVTARPGYEFELAETSIHDGGSHGALNQDDSTPPLIAAGLPESVTVPRYPRTIDIAPLCLEAMGLGDEAEALVRSRTAGRSSG